MSELRIEVSQPEGENGDYKVELKLVEDEETVLTHGTTPKALFDELAPNIRVAYEAPTLDDHDKIGSQLLQLLTPGRVGPRWNSERVQWDNDPAGITTLLELHPDCWQDLPWELLYDSSLPAHLFHHQRHAVGMRRPGGSAVKAEVRWPLRMLIVVGCDPDDKGIGWEAELDAIQRAISEFALRVDLKILQSPLTKKLVKNEIAGFRPHILHFIGHASSDDGGSLMLHGADTEMWSTEELSIALTAPVECERPRLVVLNACQTAGAEGALGNTSVARAFASIGCPAIIALRGDTLGTSAAVFSETFYDSLAELGVTRVDQAYCRALAAVSGQGGAEKRQWSLARIYFQHHAADTFTTDNCYNFEVSCDGFDDLPELKPFVNHDDRRFQLYHQLNCWFEKPTHQILLVHGDEGLGKTWLLKAVLYAAHQQGFQTAYCSEKDDYNFELEEFLKALRHGRTQFKFFGRAVYEARVDEQNPFADFDAEPTAAARDSEENGRKPLVQRFAAGLRNVATSQRVLIGLDHLEKLTTCWEDLREPLLNAVALGDRPNGLGRNVRLIIAASTSQMSEAVFDLDSLHALRIPLDRLPAQDFRRVVTQYAFRILRNDQEKLERVIRSVRKVNYQHAWELNKLEHTIEVLEAVDL